MVRIRNVPLDTADDIGGPQDEQESNAVAHQDAGQEHVA